MRLDRGKRKSVWAQRMSLNKKIIQRRISSISNWLILLLFLCFLLLGCSQTDDVVKVENNESHRVENDESEATKEPIDKQIESEVKAFEPIFQGETSKKKIALTFDDGPHPIHTSEVLQLLNQYDAKATFFMLGSQVEEYPHIAAQVAASGHEIGNHTWSHKKLTTLSEKEAIDEISLGVMAIEDAIGYQPTHFRPPFGERNANVDQLVGMPSILWTIDTRDWDTRNPESIFQIVKNNANNGQIVLMHDIYDTTVEALDLILKYLTLEGYQFVTISELIK
ncbi:polysaccharide deacetylase family protein [Amphibacillus cookii]|uniref:polysaccharide deacetylase family protein n=1 Tax=Amphibacillus cookii TaxID=767787 RepID=UPI00195890FC|nr:polysaccharide deacetylase family protein [Amphibacillus cookii]MBM7542240.1 peptidoglycan/xylan/chitin deacetylase (PgdA/CDA1 family) [Amphibacillus cookii]